MVKRNATHNGHILRMVPLQLSTKMIAGWRSEPDAERPKLIRQRQLKVSPASIRRSVDPFELREDFWRVKDEKGALDFLNRWGIRWGSEQAFFLVDVLKFQGFTKQAAVKPFSKWQKIGKEPPPDSGIVRWGSVWTVDAIESLSGIICEQCKGGLCLRLSPSDAKHAILAAVVLDKLGKNQFRLCKKPGCGLPFKLDIREKKQYCSEAHRQAEAMRRVRRRQSRKGKRQ